MRIAILTATLARFSGIDRVVENQAKKFVKDGHQVTIFTLASEIEKIEEGVNIEVLGMPRSLFWQRIYRLLFFLDFSKVRKYTEKLKNFDVIYSHQYPMNWLVWQAKKRFGVKCIFYNHGVAPPNVFLSIFEKIYIKLFTYLTNKTFKKADQVISISRYLKEVLKRETGIDSQVTEDLFKVDKNRFNPKVDGLLIRQKYGLKDNPVALYVGRISPHKGVHLLIKVFKLVNKKIPETKLLIVGKKTFSEYAKQLEKLANDSVIFTGFVSDEELPFYYAACDVYVTASLWEGFNLPIVEAQACSKPVVAFDLCSHPEVVDKNGILVKPGDINEFTDALVNLLKHNE